MRKKNNISALLFARHDDFYSKLYYDYLKKNFLVDVIWSKEIGEKISVSKLKKKS